MSSTKDDDKATEEDQSEYNKVKWARSRQRFTRSSTITHEVAERPKTRGREPIRTDSVLNGYIVSRVNLSRTCGYEKGELVRDRSRIQFACGTLSELQSFWKKTQSNSGFTSEIFSRKRGMVLTFTGSIGNIYDHRSVKEVCDVLEKVVRCTNAIVITNGQKSPMVDALARMTYNLNKKRASKEKYVTVGMMPWANIYTDLEEYDESDLFEPHHTRMFIVRPGINSKEHDAMEYVEKVIASDPTDSTYVIPRVVVAYGGGIDTLRKVYAAVDNGTVVHFIKHSGGVTDLLIAKKNDRMGTPALERQQTAMTVPKTPMPMRSSDKLLSEVLGPNHVEEGRRIMDDLTPDKLQYCRECSLDMLSIFIFLECIRNPRKDYKVLCHNIIDRGQDLFQEIMDKQQMADLLFENLTWDVLYALYKNIPPDSQLASVVDMPSVLSPTQRQVFEEINNYLEKTFQVKKEYSLPIDIRLSKKPTHKDFFVWFLLTEQLDIAHMLWIKSNQMSVHEAFLASKLLDGLKKLVYGEDNAANLDKTSITYMSHVSNVLKEANDNKEEPQSKQIVETLLLNRHFDYFNVCYERNKLDFFNKDCVIDIIRQRWYGEVQSKLESTPQKLQNCFGSFPTNKVRYIFVVSLLILLAMPFFAFALPFFMILKKDAIDSFLLRYNSAALKCCMHTIMHVIFLVVYAYMLLLRLPDYLTGTDLVMIGWVFCMFLEELRKMIVIRGSFLHKIWTYFSLWNSLDFLGVILFFVGMVLRLGPEEQDAARVCIAFSFVALTGRIFSLLYVSGYMGPKLIIFGRMFKEALLPVLAFIFLLLVAFTIADFAVLYPNSEFNWYFIQSVFKNGYWMVFNEVGIAELELKEPQCSNNATVYMEGTLPRCPSSVGQSAAPYFRGLFILLAVILLLNILLVMFIDSYKKIQEESYMRWLKTFRGVIEEYRAKAFLPPPFAVLFLFVGVIFLIAWLIAIPIRMCCRARSKVSDKKRSESKKELTEKKSENDVKMNHMNNKTPSSSEKETQDGDQMKESVDESKESEESRAPNFYEGMEVFMKIFAAMTYKEKKIERDIVRKFEKEMKQQYVKRIAPVTQVEESDVLRDQVDRTEVLERLLSEQDRALKRLEKRTARIEDDLDEMDKWMDGVDKTLAIYRGASSSAGSRRSRAKSRQGSRPVSLGEVKASSGSLTREDTHMKS